MQHRDVTGQTVGGFVMLQLAGRQPKPHGYFVYLAKCAACGDERLRLFTPTLKKGGCKCHCQGGQRRTLPEAEVGKTTPKAPKAEKAPSTKASGAPNVKSGESGGAEGRAASQARLALIRQRHKEFVKALLGEERLHEERQTWE